MQYIAYSLAKNIDTAADFFAFSGSPAPSKLPTLIPAAVPMPYGICEEDRVHMHCNNNLPACYTIELRPLSILKCILVLIVHKSQLQ